MWPPYPFLGGCHVDCNGWWFWALVVAAPLAGFLLARLILWLFWDRRTLLHVVNNWHYDRLTDDYFTQRELRLGTRTRHVVLWRGQRRCH